MNDAPKGFSKVTDELRCLVDDGSGDVSVGDALDQIGQRSHGPLLLLSALVVVAPTGAIPVVPTIMGGLIVVVGLQLILLQQRIWVPDRILRIEISRERFGKLLDFADKWSGRLRWAVRERLSHTTEGPFRVVCGVFAICMGALMPPLELAPFAAAGPALAVAVISIGLTTRDGIWTLSGLGLGFVVAGGALWLFGAIL